MEKLCSKLSKIIISIIFNYCVYCNCLEKHDSQEKGINTTNSYHAKSLYSFNYQMKAKNMNENNLKQTNLNFIEYVPNIAYHIWDYFGINSTIINSNSYLLNNASYATKELPLIAPLINNFMDQMLIDISVGTPPQQFSVLSDTGSDLFWVGDFIECAPCRYELPRNFNKDNSKTFTQTKEYIEQKYGSGTVYGYMSKDSVFLPNLNYTNGAEADSISFNFLLTTYTKGFKNIDGILGLSYNSPIRGEQYSFIEQLYLAKKIKKRIFTQRLISSSKGEFILGEYPDYLQTLIDEKNYTNFAKCDLLKEMKVLNNEKENLYWACNLNGMFAGDNPPKDKLTELFQVVLDNGSNFSYLMKDLWIKYVSLFRDLIDRRICVLENAVSIEIMHCEYGNDILNLKRINLVFGDYSISVNIRQGFYYDHGRFISKIMYGNLGISIIGQKFFKYFSIVHNKEDKTFEIWGPGVYRLDGKYRPTSEIDEFNQSDFPIYLIVIIAISSLIVVVALIYCIRRKYCASPDISRVNQYSQI